MKNKIDGLILILLALLVLGGSGCSALPAEMSAGRDPNSIMASGVIEAYQIAVSSELSGRVAEVFVAEGETVSADAVVLQLEEDLLLSQRDQAQAQYDSALAQLEGAKAAEDAARAYLRSAELDRDAAEIQFQQVLSQVQTEERVADWNQNNLIQVDVPAWYFEQPEQISAAEAELERARLSYQAEQENYQDSVADIGKQGFQEAETRLADAQAAYEIADSLNDHQVGYAGREEIEDFIKTIYESAETELKAAQKAYDQILADPEYKNILEARARVSVTKEYYDLARDYLNQLHTGEFSLDVQAAAILVDQAESGVTLAQAQIAEAENHRISAETAVTQAQAGLNLVDLQLEKMAVLSPISGVVLTRTIDPGEMLGAGYTALMIGDLSHLTVTVYLPEDRYGLIKLGDIAELRVDSYPGETFEAEVLRIADQAEYTPRNVQTQEERQNTVYAIELGVKNGAEKLKPGMPADVIFHP